MSLRRNTALNLTGQVISVAVSLAAVPPLLRMIGEARYGVLLIAWVLLGYFALFDLGVGQATSQRMAILRSGTPEERGRLVWTALVMNAAMGVAAALILFVVAHVVLGSVVSMDAALRSESLAALPWIALALPLSMVGSVFSGALQGREAFGAAAIVSTLGQVVAQGAPLLVAWRYSTSLAWLIPAALSSRVVTSLLGFLLCRNAVPLRNLAGFDLGSAKRLLSYGGWITVSSIVGPLMTSLDRLVIGNISGTEAVTYYGVPQGLTSRTLMLPASLSGALMPRLASEGVERRATLMDKSVKAVASVMTPAVVLGITLAGTFLGFWIGPEFAAKATAAAQVLFVGVWFNGMAMLAHSALLAKGRPDRIARMHLIELPCYLATLAIALRLWGVTGAAVAWALRVSVDAVLLFRMAGVLEASARALWIPTLALAGALVSARLQTYVPLLGWSASASLAVGMAVWALRTLPTELKLTWRARLPGA
ncbi:MAG: flippase [Anaeromyxobacteraceae bacterium]